MQSAGAEVEASLLETPTYIIAMVRPRDCQGVQVADLDCVLLRRSPVAPSFCGWLWC